MPGKATQRSVDLAAGREALGFAGAVLTRFALLADHGYRCVTTQPMYVRFESPRGFVQMFHDERGYEISLEIGPLTSASARQPKYDLHDLLKLFGIPEAHTYRYYCALSPRTVIVGVDELARLFIGCINAGLLSDPGLYQGLAAQSEVLTRDYNLRMQLRQMRCALVPAWQSRSYSKVRDLLTPLRDHLTPSEVKKLQYCIKKTPGH